MKAKLTTRIDAGVLRRLKVFAATEDQSIEDVVTEAVDGYLLSARPVTSGSGTSAVNASAAPAR